MEKELVCNFEQNDNCSLMRPWKSDSHFAMPCCDKETCPIWQTYLLIRGVSLRKEVLRVLQLEEHNFKIDSTGWEQSTDENGIVYLENSEGDVWEYVREVPKELIGQQLFTFSAAMRETKNFGKQIPTNVDWSFLVKKSKDIPNLVYAGYRNLGDIFACLCRSSSFWLSPLLSPGVWYSEVYFDCPNVGHYKGSPLFGFSVRCLKD